MWIIVGLGNPGARYAGTPHNLGFDVVDLLAGRLRADWSAQNKFKCLAASGILAGRKAFLLKPTTYMNLSGEAVQPFAAYYDVDPERVLVVCDDANLPWGRMRLRPKGTDGGQKGLRHILQRLGTNDVPRLRIGCAPEHPQRDLAAYVLSPIWGSAKEIVDLVRETAADCVESVLANGVEPSMTRFNGWSAEPEPRS